MSNLTEKILNALLPEGSLWNPVDDFKKYLKGQALNYDSLLFFLRSLSTIRNPLETPVLKDLEREFGISPNESQTEQQRRNFLNSFVFTSEGNGKAEDLQARLQEAGFNVSVYANDPAQDPNVILDQQFQMWAGSYNAYAGREDAFARRIGGELIVNGDKFKQTPQYNVVADGSNAYAGRSDFFAGSFDKLRTIKIEYPIPTNPNDWPLLFFVGGNVTRDVDGKIISIEEVIEPSELRDEFLKIILRYKPLHTWCISTVIFE